MPMPRVCWFSHISRLSVIGLPLCLLFPPRSVAQGAVPRASTTDQVPDRAAAQGSAGTSDLNTVVDEVSFDLSVHAKHKRAVLDLQSSQIAATDGGSPVQFSSLRRVDSSSGSRHLVTLLFDRLNVGATKSARKVAENILENIPEKGYSIGVFQVDGRLRLLEPFTQSRPQVDAAVGAAMSASSAPHLADFTPAEKKLMASLHGDALGSADRAEGKLMYSALEESQHIIEERRSYASLAALQALVESQRLASGRKFIFYFSAGVNASSDARDILRSIVSLANRAGVTIWAVDTSRVNAQMSSEMQGSMASSMLGKGNAPGNVSSFGTGSLGSSAGNASGPGGGSTMPGGAFNNVAARDIAGYEFGDVGSDQSPLVSLAFGTGGMYIGSAGGYNHQLQRLQEDLASWYEASWKPPIKEYDGQFRPVIIRSLRKNVAIRARSGYFAVPPSDLSGISPFEVPLLNILAAPVLPADVAFHAGVLHLGSLPDGNSGELVVQVPVSQLAVHEDDNTHISSVHATILAVIKDSKGTVLERFGEDFPLHESADQLRLDPGPSITLEEHFSGEPGVYSLETAVMDCNANKAGAQRATFTIEGSPAGPAVSDVALVDKVEPISEDDQSFDPMLFNDGRIVPALAAELPEDIRALSLFFLLHPVAGGKGQPALRMQIFYGGKLLTEMPMEIEKVSGTGAAIPYLATIHGGAFPPGEYQVKALLSQDGTTASSAISFHVKGTAAASNSTNPSLTAAGPDGSDDRLVSEASTANSKFVIASPATSITPPSAAEMQTTIEGVRQRALAWRDSLQNFLCLEITNHSVDATGHGSWRHRDTLVELMSYVDHVESRSTMMLNGEHSNAQPDHLEFLHSAGEFGAVFHAVFDPSAKTSFTWKRYAVLDGQTVQVYAFKVVRANSIFDLTDRAGDTERVGFHGLLYIDPATSSVRRISIDADEIPSKLGIQACSVSVDYTWITMQEHDFLLPVRGAIGLEESKKRPVLNEFEFLNYHRFGSNSRILSDAEVKSLSNN